MPGRASEYAERDAPSGRWKHGVCSREARELLAAKLLPWKERWIASDAGHEGAIVVQKVREMKEDEGFNALRDTYENLILDRLPDAHDGSADLHNPEKKNDAP